jgi:hypothetical protein
MHHFNVLIDDIQKEQERIKKEQKIIRKKNNNILYGEYPRKVSSSYDDGKC